MTVLEQVEVMREVILELQHMAKFSELSMDDKVVVLKMVCAAYEVHMAGALAVETIRRQIEQITGGGK